MNNKICRMIIVACLFTALSSCKDVNEPPIQVTEDTPKDTQTEIPAQENPNNVWVRQTDEMSMINIPGGTFQIGSTEAETEDAIALCQQHYDFCNLWYYERENPIHTVTLDEFWIDQTEISNSQYRLCVEAGICVEASACNKGEPTFNDPNKADHPVVCVSWEDAQNYCEWTGTRLPTEAEWEVAFRGESGSIYPWGNVFDGSQLNYCDQNCSLSHADESFDDGYPLTAPVSSFPAGSSWAGVYNMSGNVSEWVADWFGEYSDESVTNPSGPITGNQRMLKGGSWFSHPTYCRGAVRPSVDPDTRFDYLGFRCASGNPTASSSTPEATPESTQSKETTNTQTAPEGTLGDMWTRHSDQMVMFFVPSGTFQMGSSEDAPDVASVEIPQHEVSLDSFWIDQNEVTNAQYNLCVGAGICQKSQYANSTTHNGDDYPVVGIAWDDAVDYCTWTGGRLPTEAEWEYAAKGPEELQYPWGNDFDGNNLNYCDSNCTESWADPNIDDGYREGAPANKFPTGASWVGALDMAGNVWEWTWDWCASYSSFPQSNPMGPEWGKCKIIRGGAFGSPSSGTRTTYRLISDEITPDIRHPNIGFRCVVPSNQEGEAVTIFDPIDVPSGDPPTIDGTLSFGEWDNAAVETFADGSQLFLMHIEDYLYLGIRTNEGQPFAGNVYIHRGGKITVLHSSAALGTAIYEIAEDSWQQSQNFNWQLRDTSNSESAQAERAAFLLSEDWLASNGNMGTPNELEYQIKIQEQNLNIAVVFTKSTSPYEKVPWPAALDDDTIAPTPGGFPTMIEFFPTRWGLIEFD